MTRNRNTIASAVLAFLLTTCLIFLQSGFTYYASFQVFSAFLILGLVFFSKPLARNFAGICIIFIAFAFSMGITTLFTPEVVSRNTSNILLTYIAVLVYAGTILLMTNLEFRNSLFLLHVFRFTAVLTIIILAILIAAADSRLIPSMTPEAFLVQNNSLITNYVSTESLDNYLTFLTRQAETPRLDLFYGEPSYLGIVLFTCICSYLYCSELLNKFYSGNITSPLNPDYEKRNQKFIVIVAVICMLTIRSLSSIIYALLLLAYEFRGMYEKKLQPHYIFAFLFIVLALQFLFFEETYNYAIGRLSFSESLSFEQRFGSFGEFDFMDYLVGLKSNSKIPVVGFHNGLIYIIAASGLIGLLYIAYILRTVFKLAKPLKLSPLMVMVTLALIMQNGAVFSPNKVVLFALVLLPLSCTRSLYKSQQKTSYNPSLQLKYGLQANA